MRNRVGNISLAHRAYKVTETLTLAPRIWTLQRANGDVVPQTEPQTQVLRKTDRTCITPYPGVNAAYESSIYLCCD